MAPRGPSAAFTPIPPDLNLAALVEETPNFEYVTRVSHDMVEQQSLDAFEKLVLLHVIIGGKPLVIDGFQNKLDGWTFTSQWLQDNCGSKFEQARNLTKQSNMPLSIGHYLNNMSKLTDQWTSENYKDSDRQRIYLKDIDCPQLWHDKLEQQTLASIFYLNDSTGDLGGPGSREPNQKGIARCGDLMSCLPQEMRAENMMCYIGHEGTYTPAHREMCASLGQNLMVESSGVKDSQGKVTKPGSSIWFMTETKDRHLVSEYWLSTLGHDIEVEKHFAQIAAWKHAPFTTYIVEQKAGDFILIPPLAPHQVWNRGTRTMKVAWNRTTVETLEMALHEALPRARMVCRDEQYKNKAIIYFTLQKYSGLLKDAELQKAGERNPMKFESLKYSTKIKQLQKDFKRLFALYTEILLSEMLAPVSPSEKRGQYLPFESFVTCSYCRCNIFNRFLTCSTCTEPLPNGEEDTYDICMDCFAMGRSCACISAYKWVEQFPWQELIQKHEEWRQQILRAEDGVNSKSPKTLQAERKALSKKTLAQVCQEQLKIRPWSDPKNPLTGLTMAQKREISRGTEGEDDVDDDGKVKKKVKQKRKNFMEKNYSVEHVSLHPEERWKLATCSKCDRSYNYGSLWRMFDLMPLTVMENPAWKCPFCLRICSCGGCRKKDSMTPYEPQGTVLGHDTKAVADRRSMEHLVDFSHSNMRWIVAVGDDNAKDSRRLNRRKQEAEIAKSQDPTLDENYIDEPDDALFIEDNTDQDAPMDLTIDPALLTMGASPDKGRATNSSASRKSQKLPARTQSSATNIENGDSSPQVNGSNRPSSRMSPETGMDHAASFVSNGITYEYPDPTEAQSVPFNQSPQSPQVERPTEPSARQLKVKRKAELSLLQTDAAPEAPKAGPNQLSQHQANQGLQQAREDGRYTMAEAALTGKSLVVSLPIASTRLVAINQTQSKPAVTKPPTRSINDLLQSDLPYEDATRPKRKKAKQTGEDDSEFRIHHRTRIDSAAPTTTTTAAPPKSTRIISYAEADSATSTSEDEDIIMASSSGPPTPTRGAGGKHTGPCALPGYLAQRNEGLDLPDELPAEEPRRRSVPGGGAKKTPPINNNKDFNHSINFFPRIPPKNPRGRPPKNRPEIEKTQQLSQLSPAERLAEANHRAKVKAVNWADAKGGGKGDESESGSGSEGGGLGGGSGDDDEESSDELALNDGKRKGRIGGGSSGGGGSGGGGGARGKLMAVPMSMLERKRMLGKKVRVASAKSVGRK